MANFSLDDIRSAAEAKYGSLEITFDEGKTLVMLNPLKLDKATRKEIASLQDKNDEADSDQEEILSEMIVKAASNKEIAADFLAVVGGDLTIIAEVLDRYGKLTQVGEASASAS